MDAGEREIFAAIQRGLPSAARPYALLSRRVGKSEEDILRLIRRWQRQGLVRRFGAVLDQRALGLRVNCLCVWQAPQACVARLARLCRNESHISHCYRRSRSADWPFNVYAMMHCRSRQDCLRLIQRISDACGVPGYRALFTLKQFKKTSPRYLITRRRA